MVASVCAIVDEEGKTQEIDIWVLTWADLAGGLGIEAEKEEEVQDESGLFTKPSTITQWVVMVGPFTCKRRSRFGGRY